MKFGSILYEQSERRPADSELAAPAFFKDLNCDQIVDSITAGKAEYNLNPFYFDCLRHVEEIDYRQGVFQELENPEMLDLVRAFARRMQVVRADLEQVQKLHYKEEKEAWFLDAVETYCESIRAFSDNLSRRDFASRGFVGFRGYLVRYASSNRLVGLLNDAKRLKAALAQAGYCVLIKGDKFTVRRDAAEADYSVEVEKTFDKFKQGAVNSYLATFREQDGMNHIEAKVAEFVAKLYPDVFAPVQTFVASNRNFMDETIVRFDREIQFYLAYLDYIAPLKQSGLSFCYPQVSDRNKQVVSRDGFDIALAHKLAKENAAVVANDFELKGRERVLLVSGPNQGGKTTFARAFGQLHYLASLGCPVPGTSAQLFLFDHLFTHFEREEKVESLRGKLEDDLVRVHHILDRASSRSVIVMNEIFTSTTIHDETWLSERVMKRIVASDMLAVWVTFVDELAWFGPQIVSMVSTVVPDNPALRTFKIVRRPADGLAYAMAIAQKYRLTYDAIVERIRS